MTVKELHKWIDQTITPYPMATLKDGYGWNFYLRRLSCQYEYRRGDAGVWNKLTPDALFSFDPEQLRATAWLIEVGFAHTV
jgi:hypothetical protein